MSIINIISLSIVTIVIYFAWLVADFIIMYLRNIQDISQVKNKVIRFIVFFPIYLTVGIKFGLSKIKSIFKKS
jgi:hypothetical protein